jgi:hypothetical protein
VNKVASTTPETKLVKRFTKWKIGNHVRLTAFGKQKAVASRYNPLKDLLNHEFVVREILDAGLLVEVIETRKVTGNNHFLLTDANNELELVKIEEI